MQTEIEAKFTDIGIDRMREKLSQAGATLVHAERLMRRHIFHLPDGENAWVRVRDEGDKVTMTYKHTAERTLHGTKEVDLIVDDFVRATEFLEAVGLRQKSIQETKRETWSLKECEVTIDTWPWVPTCSEVEGPTEEAVRAVASMLELDWSKALQGGIEPLYQRYYAVTEEEVRSWSSMTFGPVPEWLEKVKKSL